MPTPYSPFRTPTSFHSKGQSLKRVNQCRSNGSNLSGTNAVLDGITGQWIFRGSIWRVSFMNSDLHRCLITPQCLIQLPYSNLSAPMPTLSGPVEKGSTSGGHLSVLRPSSRTGCSFQTLLYFQTNTFQPGLLSGTNAYDRNPLRLCRCLMSTSPQSTLAGLTSPTLSFQMIPCFLTDPPELTFPAPMRCSH